MRTPTRFGGGMDVRILGPLLLRHGTVEGRLTAPKPRKVLALWHGPPLVDVPHGPLLAVEVRRLEEDRLTAVQQRIDADLWLGRHHEVLSELTGLAARYPTHENLHAQYLLALYRAGRRTDALQAYRRLRT